MKIISKRTTCFTTGIVIFLMFQKIGAQIIDCIESHQGGAYLVYLDEPSYSADSPGSEGELQKLMEKLVFRLNSVMVGVTQEVGVTASCLPIYCTGRKPQRITDFNIELVEKLNMQDVILEVWGALESKTNEMNVIIHKARIYYLLIPVWTASVDEQIQPGLQLAEYESDPESGTEEPIDLLQDAPELRIYVEIGIGINQLLNQEYDDARKLLCAARCNLEHYVNTSSPTGPNEKESKLIEYIDQLARETVTLAKRDSHYNGALELYPNDEECPCTKGGNE